MLHKLFVQHLIFCKKDLAGLGERLADLTLVSKGPRGFLVCVEISWELLSEKSWISRRDLRVLMLCGWSNQLHPYQHHFSPRKVPRRSPISLGTFQGPQRLNFPELQFLKKPPTTVVLTIWKMLHQIYLKHYIFFFKR
jgi:hypothetical protein